MKKLVFIPLFLLLIYTRFIGLDWGLPYPMHPDERNMANAIQSLNCEIRNQHFEMRNCFNPHFFAYGQFSLYIGYLLIQIYHLITQKLFIPITFTEAVMSLRVISAIASILTVFVLMRIMRFFKSGLETHNRLFFVLSFLFFIFQPYFIQFSHFGTTESLLMLLYVLIVYCSLQLFNKLEWKTIIFISLFLSLAIGTKVSSIIFITIPSIVVLFSKSARKNLFPFIFSFLLLTIFFSFLFSPHNFISFNDFSRSMNYESAVAMGKTKIFYTRQFEHTVSIWFQLSKIFPYVLGIPQYILAVAGFLFLSWRKKEINVLRFAFLIYFIPTSFLYVKWTRFMAPVFPILSVFAVLFVFLWFESIKQFFKKLKIKSQKLKVQFKIKDYFLFLIYGFSFFIFLFSLFIPALAYLSIYQNPDVRFTASEWIYIHIPEGSYILSETASVVDIPIESQKSKIKSKKYQYISFNFYELDKEVELQNELQSELQKADYIIIPSRRVFKNHPRSKYPRLNDYYQKLFSGELGFQKVAEFTSYPRIELFGKTLFEFPDEDAEETWSVFDHPVVRIYKRL